MMAVDASVAAKWLLPEPGQAEADTILRGPSALLAPTLIRLEVSAAIARRFRLGALTAEEVERHFRNWLAMLQDRALLLLPDEELLEDALKLSITVKHPLQDCLYLAAARHYDAPLVTADEPFHKRMLTIYPRITLLKVGSLG